MARTALIFPGQGSQTVGMGKDVCAASARARAVFDEANAVVGFDLARLCFEGPASELEKTDIQQPAIFVTSVALWEALLEAGAVRSAFSACGGLSLGEYTALYVAGGMSFAEALRLVQLRGRLMQEASEASPSGMVSLIGADEETARSICAQAAEGEILVPANFNCPGQVVLSGSKDACGRALKVAEEAGSCRAVLLAVAGAFHSPFMESAAQGLAPVLAETEFAVLELPTIANVNAEYHPDPVTTRDWLQRQVTEPVLWQRCIERMIADGVERFVEIGPGRVLTGLLRKINRKVPAVNVSTFEAVTEALEEVSA